MPESKGSNQLIRKILNDQLFQGRDVKLASTINDLLELAEVKNLDELAHAGVLKASTKGSLFHTLFGRDAIRMAIDLYDDYPSLAHKVVIELGKLQGVGYDELSEEEPGKIMHEHRVEGDPIREVLDRKWRFPYYGTVDATPQFINLVTHAARDDLSILEHKFKDRNGRSITVLDSLERALGWLSSHIEQSTKDLVEFKRINPQGILNQVWKDSDDAYVDENLELPSADYPVASIEVQGYAISAYINSSYIYERLANTKKHYRFADRSEEFKERAEELIEKTKKYFYKPKLGFWSSAIYSDQHGRGISHKSYLSNPGHLLNSRIFDTPNPMLEKGREALIRQMFQPGMLSLVGIRTRSSDSAAYQPGSYHNGSVWPVDTGIISQGLRRQGYNALARELEYRILYGIDSLGKHVEFFRGDSITEPRINEMLVEVAGRIVEQPPQANQGWTITRVYKIKHQLARDYLAKAAYQPKDAFEERLLAELLDRRDLKTYKTVSFGKFREL